MPHAVRSACRVKHSNRQKEAAGVVAAGAEYEEDPIDIDPSQPEEGAAAGACATAATALVTAAELQLEGF